MYQIFEEISQTPDVSQTTIRYQYIDTDISIGTDMQTRCEISERISR